MSKCAVERCPIPPEPPIPITINWPQEEFGLPISSATDTVTFEVPLCIFHREVIEGAVESLELAAAIRDEPTPAMEDEP